MADKKIAVEIDVNAKGASKTLGQLEADFERLNQEIKEVPLNSKKFNELQKELAQTGREVKNVELAFESLDNEQVASELGSVAGAVGDVSAAFILLGDDSETLQEVAKNIELAMGVSMGLKGAIEGVSSARKLLNNSTIVSNTLQKLNTAGTFIAATAQKTYALAVGTSTGAMKLFRIALLATGIGAIIVGLGLLIANFDKVTGAVQKAVTWFSNLGEGVKLAISIMLPFIGVIRLINAALESFGVKEDETTKRTNAARKARIKQIREETKQTIEQNNKKIKSVQEYTTKVVESLDWEIKKRTAAGKDVAELELKKLKVLRDSAEQQVKLLEETAAAATRSAAQNNDLLAGLAAGVANKTLENQKKTFKEAEQNLEIAEIEKATKQKEYTEAEGKRREEAAAKQLEADKAAHKKRSDARKSQAEKDAADLKAQEEEEARLLAEKIFKIQEAGDKRRELEKQQALELSKLRADARELELIELEENYVSKFEMAVGNAALEEALQRELNEKKAAINDEYRDKQREADKQEIQAQKDLNRSKVEMGSEALGALSTLVSAFSTNNEKNAKKQFQVNKALNLAQASTNTALAVTAALTAGGNPIKLATGAQFVEAGIAGALGLANIAKIASTQFGSSGGGGSTVSLGNTSNAVGGANVPAVSNTTTTLDGNTQVFVTEQDISSTQNKVQVAEDIATV